ncbi:MAG: hypothetical protein JNM55_12055 [Anaerolineales bacterium]|nr:hypothetical protein [Anaerolineales bacterium]
MSFQQPSKSLTKRDYQFIALVAGLFLILSAALIFLNLRFEKGGGDFYVHWVAARAFSVDKIEPYSGDVASRVQGLVYGTPARAGDEPYILDTPFHILLLYFPFALLSDPALARAVFTLILELALAALVYLSLRLTDWESPRLFTILFILFGIFNFYSLQAIHEANPVLMLGLIYVGIVISYYAETDEMTGALLAVSFYYWEVGAPFLILVILRAYHEKRMRILAGFVMVNFILLFITYLIYPDWLIPFLRAGWNNLRIPFGFNTFAVFADIWPAYGLLVSRIFVAGLLVMLGYEFALARSRDFRQFYWALCLSIAAAPLLGLRTEMEHLSVLVIPLALVFAIVHERWKVYGSWLAVLLLGLVYALPWVIRFFATEHFLKISNEIVFLFPPIFTIAGLYWIRWWAIRPPRVWSDLTNRK